MNYQENHPNPPVLSIGIIFKNEIRCLERCVQSLQPLREALPCELIMADTGSEDGSHAIAEQYADIFFQFPWIDDFAAARNAVLDRASGEWFFSIDADEWLDTDLTELLNFFQSEQLNSNYENCGLIIRNHMSTDPKGIYHDFLGVRMFRRSTGIRFEGRIHEHWSHGAGVIYGLGNTILHHDGYIDFTGTSHAEKQKRNMELLKQELAEQPDNLLLLLQCIESSDGKEQYQFIRRAIEEIQRGTKEWDKLGAPIYRHAVTVARTHQYPEYDQWLEEIQTLFPDSLFTRIDVAFTVFINYADQKDYPKAIEVGEAYLQALQSYRTLKDHVADMAYSSLTSASTYHEDQVRILLANAYFYEKNYEKSIELLHTMDADNISIDHLRNYIGCLINLHAQTDHNMCEEMATFWKQITADTLDKTDRNTRKNVLYATATPAFAKEFRDSESEHGFQHGYTIFLFLEGQCSIGDAAAILDTFDVEKMEAILSRQEDFSLLPVAAIAHAMTSGVRFPLANRILKTEEMDTLALRLSRTPDTLRRILEDFLLDFQKEDLQELSWARALILAAVSANDWEHTDDPEKVEYSMWLAHRFTDIEQQFISCYFAADLLTEAHLHLLPPAHRFGWYCWWAFHELERGKKSAYVHYLRLGLDTYKNMKPMVEFLMNHSKAMEPVVEVSPELEMLANQVRTILARYSPDDPSVIAIKQSEAYQKVAYLLESTPTPVWGGQVQ